jgi:hypothetical protein
MLIVNIRWSRQVYVCGSPLSIWHLNRLHDRKADSYVVHQLKTSTLSTSSACQEYEENGFFPLSPTQPLQGLTIRGAGWISYTKQELLTRLKHLGWLPILMGSMLLTFLVFCVVFCLSLSCVLCLCVLFQWQSKVVDPVNHLFPYFYIVLFYVYIIEVHLVLNIGEILTNRTLSLFT